MVEGLAECFLRPLLRLRHPAGTRASFPAPPPAPAALERETPGGWSALKGTNACLQAQSLPWENPTCSQRPAVGRTNGLCKALMDP